MPELVDEDTKTVANKLKVEARLERSMDYMYISPHMEKIVREGKIEIIGKGAECVVISPKKHPGKKAGGIWQKPELRDDIAVAIDYRLITAPDEAKRVFYTQRVLSTLFPHNFPRFYTSYGGDKQVSLSGTIRQRIHKRKGFWTRVKYPFRHVEDTVRELGLSINFDTNPVNFMIAGDGGEYYLDKSRVYGTWADKEGFYRWDSAKIAEYMGTNGYTDIQKRIVSKSIDRLRSLSYNDVRKNKPL